MPKICIVIPVYKVEKYLPACLDSILAQTFPDWEAICVNDGSPDNCDKILAEYARKDARIQVVSQANKGVSAARNEALKRAKGDYICFLDSDDEFAPTFLEKMHRALTEKQADVAWCDYQQGADKKDWQAQEKQVCVYTDVFLRFLQENPNMGACIWNKLYRREILQGFQFPDKTNMGEDLVFLYQVLSLAQKVAYVPEQLYFYRCREDSAMNSGICEKSILGNIKAAELLEDYFKNQKLSPQIHKILNQKIAKRIFKFGISEPKKKDKKNRKKWYLMTRPLLLKLKRQSIYQPKYLTIKNRIISWLFLQNWNWLFYWKIKIKKLQIRIFGISVSFVITPRIRKMLQKIQAKQPRILLKRDGRIRVGFLVTECSKWGYQSVYDLFKEHKDFEPIILITKTFIEHKGRENCGHSFQDCCDFFTKKGMPFEIVYDTEKKCPIPLDQFDIGIVFYQQPWDVAKEHHPYEVSRYALTCYIPYSFNLLNNDFLYLEGFDRWLDLDFLISSSNLEELKENVESLDNCLVSGFPKLDYYHDVKEKKKDKVVIIYAPHHSFDLGWLNLATFKKNGKEILKLAQQHQDTVDWVFKPHPRFKYSLLLNNIMTEQEIEEYYNAWKKIGTIYEGGDYLDLFKNSDALITDCCSFLAEYLPSGHPVFHLVNEGIQWNKLARSFLDSYYTAESFEQLEKDFHRVILEKDDYKKKERLSKIPLVFDEKEKAASKIYQEVIKCLKEKNLE